MLALQCWSPSTKAVVGQSAGHGRSGIVRCVLAGDTRRVLGQVVCDREPGRLVDGTQKVLAGFPHREKGLGRPNHLSSHTSSKRQPL